MVARAVVALRFFVGLCDGRPPACPRPWLPQSELQPFPESVTPSVHRGGPAPWLMSPVNLPRPAILI